jgi:sec-independent protein translocase protein TatB
VPFGDLGFGELLVVAVLALFVFGPERLPTVAADAAKALRSLRRTLKGLTDDLKTELGPEVGDLDLASLHPKAFVRKHLLEDDPDDAPGPPRQRALASGEAAPWDPETT